jgi:hypothetical protein
MIVILCHPADSAALWLYGALRDIGLEGIALVSVEQLVYSTRIVHRLDASGDTGSIHLADGRILRPESIRGLVNRVHYLPTQHFAAAQAADQAYATQELSAFLLAWLDGVAGRVINPPMPFALDGSTFHLMTLVQLAAMAGLPTTPWRAGTKEDGDAIAPLSACTHTGLVFDGRLFGSLLPRPLQEACRRLAALIGVPLLEVRLHQSAERGWCFLGASGAADFRNGGRALAAAVAHALAPEIEAA